MAPITAGTNLNDLVSPSDYIRALASFVRLHESKLADFSRRHPTPSTVPSWTTLLTLGIISSDIPVARKPPLILRLDPHHLYFILLKAEEAGVSGLGSLDVLIDGGPTRPMSINYGNSNLNYNGGMLERDSDTMSFRSTFSAVSSFSSLGSGWWGTSSPPIKDTTNIDVKYIYSSMTKLPALRLTPFSFSTTSTTPTSTSTSRSQVPTLSKPVKDFQDCPPPDTAVPLYAFKNLSNLILEDLDPRAFLGWDILSAQLRSLEVKRSGIEDVGELLCDAVVEDFERRKKGRGGVGEERRRRQGSSLEESIPEVLSASIPQPSTVNPTSTEDTSITHSYYPVPPPSAWSRLIHLSLTSNSLTFIPSTPLLYLSALTSLDLSSNLLISVPSGLSSLHSLRSLNLSDNMIDSLLGISKALGNVQVINLSKNRIDNLSGLDRLLALERIDLRENRLSESLEISRLTRLPLLREVWIESNPFSKMVLEGGEDQYRVKCFDYFAKEGKEEIKLDGTGPGMGERRGLALMRDAAGRAARGGGATNGNRRSSHTGHGEINKLEEARNAGGDAKVVGRRIVTAPHHPSKSRSKQDLLAIPSTSPSTSISSPHASTSNLNASPTVSPTKLPHRKRKPQRIVNLDGVINTPTSSVAGSTTNDQKKLGEESGTTSGGDNSDLLSSSPHNNNKSQLLYKSNLVGKGSSITEGRQSQYYKNSSSSLGPTSTTNFNNGKQTRRQRISASTFEDPTTTNSTSQNFTGQTSTNGNDKGKTKDLNSAEAFRKRVEALRNEVGESWLSVLGEREAALEKKSQSDSSASEGKKVLGLPVEDETSASVVVEGVKVIKVGKKGKKGKRKEVV